MVAAYLMLEPLKSALHQNQWLLWKVIGCYGKLTTAMD
jgi:hypothetical protein